MTLLGKVFTGLLFLLSVIFFALSVAVNVSHINQKKAADDWQAKARTAEQAVTQIRVELESYKSALAVEQAARRQTLATLQDQVAAAIAAKETAERSLTDIQTAETSASKADEVQSSQNQARTQENQLLRQQLTDARQDRDQMFQRLVTATDKNNRLQSDYAALVLRERDLADDYTKAKEKLEILGIKPDTSLEAPPSVNGEVLAVNSSGLVELSLGRDDGLREGFTLEVSRRGQYLGRVMVKTVRDDKSVAKILDGYRRGYIQTGDRVDSKLY